MTTTTDSFQPNYGSGVTVAPTTASASSSLGNGSTSIVITNLSATITSYVRIGSDTQTATTADYPVLPGTQITLSKDRTETTVAYVTASGTGSLHIIAGRGL